MHKFIDLSRFDPDSSTNPDLVGVYTACIMDDGAAKSTMCTTPDLLSVPELGKDVAGNVRASHRAQLLAQPSPAFQERLFFGPQKSEQVLWRFHRLSRCVSVEGHDFVPDPPEQLTYDFRKTTFVRIPRTPNLCLFSHVVRPKLSSDSHDIDGKYGCNSDGAGLCDSCRLFQTETLDDYFLVLRPHIEQYLRETRHPGSFYQSMNITHPPTPNVMVRVFVSRNGKTLSETHELHEPGGIKSMQIWSLIEPILDRFEGLEVELPGVSIVVFEENSIGPPAEGRYQVVFLTIHTDNPCVDFDTSSHSTIMQLQLGLQPQLHLPGHRVRMQ